jgi:hypothetical protein
MEKPCCRCRCIKSIREFNKDKSEKDGLCPLCKECRKKSRKKYYLANKEIIIGKQRNKRRQCQEWVRQFKDKCKTCGETHPACLDFHHVGDKEAGIANMIHTRNITDDLKIKIIAEIKKCEVLCSNCHRKVHWEERTK